MPTRFALKVTLAYVVFAAAWIALSDHILSVLVHDSDLIAWLSTLKGWGFVGLTALLLFALLSRGEHRLNKEIAARAEIEKQLRQWADAFEHCTHGIALGETNTGRIVACNSAFAGMHGYKVSELVGLTAYSLYEPADHDRLRRQLMQSDTAGRVQYEAKSRRKDGTLFDALSDVVSLRDHDGGILYHVTTKCDITEQKRAIAALRESEERFRAVVENIREIFWMTTGDGRRVLYVSPSYEVIWGRSCATLLSAPESWIEAVHVEDRPRVSEAARTRLSTGTFDEQYRVVRPDGSERWVRDHAFSVRNAEGGIDRIVGIVEDITERKKLEAQFLRAQRMEAVGMLAGGVAHDLNNILAPMLMAAGLLKESITETRDREMLTMVENSARRGGEIVRQLLTFSRGAEGARAPVQIRHLLKEMAAIIRDTFPREISLHEDHARDLWPIVADPTQIHQVLVNLCVNARDAMPYGGRLGLRSENVTLSRQDLPAKPECKPGPYIAVSVSDTGMGMSPEVLERIFDPFFTTKGPERGTGLGLSTVQSIVLGHGGFIAVNSSVGRGSVFKILLPAAPGRCESDEAVSDTPFPRGHGECILVVDDEAPIRASIQEALQQHNYTVLTAANGKEAITTFLTHRDRVRLVLTDEMMPEMGGVPLMRALRLLDPRMKFIVASGLESDAKRDEFTAVGVQKILPKPSGPKALLEAVREVLQQPAPTEGRYS